jgi:hypothetical protein
MAANITILPRIIKFTPETCTGLNCEIWNENNKYGDGETSTFEVALPWRNVSSSRKIEGNTVEDEEDGTEEWTNEHSTYIE